MNFAKRPISSSSAKDTRSLSPCSKLPQAPRSRSLCAKELDTCKSFPRMRPKSAGEENACNREQNSRPSSNKNRSRLPVRVSNEKCPKCLCAPCVCSPCEEKKTVDTPCKKAGKPSKCVHNCKTCMCHFCLKEKKKKLEERIKNRLCMLEETTSLKSRNCERSRWEQNIPQTPEVMSKSHPQSCQCEKCSGNSLSGVKLKDLFKQVNCMCCTCSEQTFYDTFENLDDINACGINKQEASLKIFVTNLSSIYLKLINFSDYG